MALAIQNGFTRYPQKREVVRYFAAFPTIAGLEKTQSKPSVPPIPRFPPLDFLLESCLSYLTERTKVASRKS